MLRFRLIILLMAGISTHLAGNFFSKLPWIHHLPKNLFLNLIKSGRPQDIEEVTRLHSIRLSPEKFEAASKISKFKVFKKEFYLIRPVYKMKFGLPPVKMSILTVYLLLEIIFASKRHIFCRNNLLNCNKSIKLHNLKNYFWRFFENRR